MTTDFKIRDAVKLKIVQDLIEPYYIHDIESKIRGKKCWKKTAQICETISKVLVAAGGIISFSSGYYKDETLSFFAGTISTLSLAVLQFASFAYLENKKQGQELNVLLKKLDLDIVPIVEQTHLSQRQGSEINSGVEESFEMRPLLIKTPAQEQQKIMKPSTDGLIVSEFVPNLKEI